VLSQVLSASFLKQKFKKFRETLAGHLKSASRPHVGQPCPNPSLP